MTYYICRIHQFGCGCLWRGNERIRFCGDQNCKRGDLPIYQSLQQISGHQTPSLQKSEGFKAKAASVKP